MRELLQIVNETSSEPQISGQMDVLGLARFLSLVDDVPAFQSAIAALQSGATLTQQQQVQLAKAFISLMDATPQVRQQIANKLQSVGAPQSAPQQVSQ